MFDGDWVKRHSPWIAGIGGGILLLGFLIYGFVEQVGYNQYSQAQAANYARYAAEEQKNACVGIAPAKLAECRAKAQAEYDLKANAGDRDYSDLIAQRKSALWGMIMGIAALIGMVLSVIGVILVKRTFDETQRTNRLAMKEHARATRRAVANHVETERALQHAEASAKAMTSLVDVSERTAKAQIRAYVNVTPHNLKHYDTATYVDVLIDNKGSTPAKITRLEMALWIGPPANLDPANSGAPLKRYYHVFGFLMNGVPQTITVATDQIVVVELHDGTPQQREIYIYGRVEYTDVFTESHITQFAFRTEGLLKGENTTFCPCIDGNHSD